MREQSYFYTEEPIMERVTKAEYEDFINKYPRRLDVDCCGICEPPLITHNDFELANRFPYSVIAKTWYYSDDMTDLYYEPEEEREYYIMTNYEEVFNSKTGNKEE